MATDEIPLDEREFRQIALPIFEGNEPTDTRPRQAIDGAYTFPRGGRRTAALRAKAGALTPPPAKQAAPPTTQPEQQATPATAAYLQPKASAHQVKDVLGAGAHAARAADLAAGDAPEVGAEHLRWRYRQELSMDFLGSGVPSDFSYGWRAACGG